MIEALWSIEFIANTGDFGAGVVVFESGRLFGGDSGYFYVGNYRISAGILTAEVIVNHYSGPFNSVFGSLTKFTLSLSGQVNQNTFDVIGTTKEFPGNIYCRLTHRSELP